jgi:hypothetical protein
MYAASQYKPQQALGFVLSHSRAVTSFQQNRNFRSNGPSNRDAELQRLHRKIWQGKLIPTGLPPVYLVLLIEMFM